LRQNILIGILVSREFINKTRKKVQMVDQKPLVVIVDEEARRNLTSLSFRWFYGSRERNNGTYVLETPLGERVEITGTLVENPRVNVHSAEFFYLETTPACQLNCAHCGVKGDALKTKGDVTREDVPYLTEDFARALQKDLLDYPYVGMSRALFFGGGEPFISPSKFAQLQNILTPLPKTVRIVTTNGLPLPLDKDAFAQFMEAVGTPQIMLSYSDAHRHEYERMAANNLYPGYVPAVEPEHALDEKAAILQRHCKELGYSFTINQVERQVEPVSSDLREWILRSAKSEPKIIHTTIDGRRDPCSQGEELAVRSNGRVYPHCYHIFNGQYYIGRMGLLLKGGNKHERKLFVYVRVSN